MVLRDFWIQRIHDALQRRSVLWLSGIRRTGKTFLCRSIPNTEYFDCELPRVRREMQDPQAFLDSLAGRTIVLDEIHRLDNPSEILKIASDHYPETKVIATGSSTLGASSKFRDTLAGRKTELWLTPMISSDLADFRQTDLAHRFLRGGLPPFFLSPELPERDFQEWMDAYWAKDIQELFRLERRHSFLKCVELLLAQSGGIFEATRFAKSCEVSRGTISNYLSALEATFVVHVIRPFNTHRATEIVAAPKVYAFDTGFVCYYRGWHDLRPEDMGTLWEHYVMNELFARLQSRRLCYWRDKDGHEVDFVVDVRGEAPMAIECKWSASDFDAKNLQVFRRHYSVGDNYVVASDVDRPYSKTYGAVTVHFVGLDGFIASLRKRFPRYTPSRPQTRAED
jgi:predicted AAA+ superfamily ATPase